MDRSPKETFMQRRYTDGQKAQENVLNIANYLRNANQSYNEVSTHTCQNDHQQKCTNNKFCRGYGGNGNILYCGVNT